MSNIDSMLEDLDLNHTVLSTSTNQDLSPTSDTLSSSPKLIAETLSKESQKSMSYLDTKEVSLPNNYVSIDFTNIDHPSAKKSIFSTFSRSKTMPSKGSEVNNTVPAVSTESNVVKVPSYSSSVPNSPTILNKEEFNKQPKKASSGWFNFKFKKESAPQTPTSVNISTSAPDTIDGAELIQQVQQRSKTRLSSLPPKDPEEDKKHQKQFELMMLKAKQAEAEKLRQTKHHQTLREEEMHKQVSIWINELLPNWKNPKFRQKIEKAIQKEIPSSCRGKVWSLVIGNRKKLDKDSYKFLCERFKNPPGQYKNTLEVNAKLIKEEVERVYPELRLFSNDGPMNSSILNILGAHCSLTPTEVYTQSVGQIVGTLLLNLDEFESFVALESLLEVPLYKSFYTNSDKLRAYVEAFNMSFSERLPKLFVHFHSIQLRTEMYLTSWILNLYSYTLPIELLSFLWDNYFLFNSRILYKIGLLILETLEPFLYGRLDESLPYLTSKLKEGTPLTLQVLKDKLHLVNISGEASIILNQFDPEF